MVDEQEVLAVHFRRRSRVGETRPRLELEVLAGAHSSRLNSASVSLVMVSEDRLTLSRLSATLQACPHCYSTEYLLLRRVHCRRSKLEHGGNPEGESRCWLRARAPVYVDGKNQCPWCCCLTSFAHHNLVNLYSLYSCHCHVLSLPSRVSGAREAVAINHAI